VAPKDPAILDELACQLCRDQQSSYGSPAHPARKLCIESDPTPIPR
jgi:hypothetical protein